MSPRGSRSALKTVDLTGGADKRLSGDMSNLSFVYLGPTRMPIARAKETRSSLGDVKTSHAIRQAEVAHPRTMISRTSARFGLSYLRGGTKLTCPTNALISSPSAVSCVFRCNMTLK